MSDFPRPARPRNDQADGLRRLFSASQVRFLAVVSNPHVPFSGVMLERITAACSAAGHHTLVVDAADTSPAPHELSVLELAGCIEPLASDVSYLAARGLPLRYVDARGSCGSMLDALTDAAPRADVVLVHAGASELGRIFAQRPLCPVLLAADQPTSVTHAYAAMKLLVLRNRLMTFDLLLAAAPTSSRRNLIAEKLTSCADEFLGAVLRDWAPIDPASDIGDRPTSALTRLMQTQLAGGAQVVHEPMPPASAWQRQSVPQTGQAWI